MTDPREESLAEHPLMPRSGQLVAQRYRILGVLGEGGFSVVYLGKDEHAGGKVALKVLGPAKSKNPKFVDRFQREVRVVRELRHHNTIKVYDMGSTETGCLFMVTEYLVGETLGSLMAREGRLTVERVIHITTQILHSLAEAHRAGVIHRDLKPANVMICDVTSEPDYVKVLDFGVAKADIATHTQMATSPGDFMYTPQYAAPEVLTGATVTSATDIYSVGLLLIEMLTGQKAVDGKTVWHVMARQVSDIPVRISPSLAVHPIARVIERAVTKDPAQRYAAAQDMLDDLLGIGGTVGLIGKDQGEGSDEDELLSVVAPGATRLASRGRTRGVALALGAVLVAAALGAALIYVADPLGGSGEAPGPVQDTIGAQPGTDPAGNTELAEQLACDRGDRQACLLAARRYSTGSGAERDPLRGLSLLESACRDGHLAEACLEAADQYRQGPGVSGESSVALAYIRMACEAGDTDACVTAGYELLNLGGDGGHARQAFPLLVRACDGGQAFGCAALAGLYANGLGVERDPVRALELYARACVEEVWAACTRQGLLLFEGNGVSPDLDRARVLFGLACDHDDWEGCATGAMLYHRGLGTRADGEQATTLYQRACDGGLATGCAGLGSLLEQGSLVERDLERSRSYYDRGCAMGAAVACYALGEQLSAMDDEESRQAARDRFQRACDLGNERGCQRLSEPRSGP